MTILADVARRIRAEKKKGNQVVLLLGDSAYHALRVIVGKADHGDLADIELVADTPRRRVETFKGWDLEIFATGAGQVMA